MLKVNKTIIFDWRIKTKELVKYEFYNNFYQGNVRFVHFARTMVSPHATLPASARPDASGRTDVSLSWEARILWWCLIAFGFSFALDYRAPDIGFGAAKTGGSIFQYAMLGMAVGSGAIAVLVGWRQLIVRPGVYLILIWWAYLVLNGSVSILQGNDLSRIVRLMVVPLLIGLGFTITHMAVSAGVTPKRILQVFLAVCAVNIIWQTGFSYATSPDSLLATRPVLSPGVRYIFAWTAVCVLLADRIRPTVLVLFSLAVFVCILCLTRSAAIYFTGAVSGAVACVLLALLWRQLTLSHVLKRVTAFAAIGVVGLVLIVLMLAAVPTLGDWWIDRLFYSDGGGATTEDMSILMRKAEAKAMIDILRESPLAFIHGKGFGAPYYWDDSFLPELVLVYPDPSEFPEEIYTAGHSLWTYALFSGGVIGVVCWLLLFAIPIFSSIRSGALLSRLPAPENDGQLHLVYFGAVALWTMFCSSILENPFDDRLAGPLTGIAAGLPQYYFNRAWHLRQCDHPSENSLTDSAAVSPPQQPPATTAGV